MPPPNLVLTEFPTEVYNPSLVLVGKVAQAKIDVFDHHAKLMNCLQITANIMQSLNVGCADWTAAAE